MLFRVRIGFTGTPSGVLPKAFKNEKGERCAYEPGDNAQIISTLTSPEHLSVEVVDSKHPAAATSTPGMAWSVDSLLQYVASNAVERKWFALIDMGALITGFSNLEVAHELMSRGLRDGGLKGVVYLNDKDEKCVLMADGREGVPIAVCGLKPDERFTFFDQIHCTGMDIPQAPNAGSVATLGKGMTLCDHAQACYGMRGLGKGQFIVVLVIPEIATQIEKLAEKLAPEPDEQRALLRNVMAWLISGQLASESVQRKALVLQQLRDCWRLGAMQAMLAPSPSWPSVRASPWRSKTCRSLRTPPGLSLIHI